jgi:hypothetical protein
LDRRSDALGLHDPRGATACLNSAMRRRGREDDEKKDNGGRQRRFRCETTRRWRNEIGPTKLHVYRIFPREKCHQQVLPTSTPPRNRLRGARPPCGSARPVGSAPRTRRRMERGVLARARARRAAAVAPPDSSNGSHDKPKKSVYLYEHWIFEGGTIAGRTRL